MPDDRTPQHPADMRWELAHVRFEPAISPPGSSCLAGRDCKLIWADREDWQRREGIR